MKSVVIISEGTGITARRLLDAILAHYDEAAVEASPVEVRSGVRTREALEALLGELPPDCLVVYSLIDPQLSDFFAAELKKRQLLAINILAPMRDTVVEFLGRPSDYAAGKLQSSRGAFYRKMDAIGFTVEHDDGLGKRHAEADIVLVGPSRTVKTPTAMFISTHYGLKVANLPIVADDLAVKHLLDKLVRVPKERVFGMLMQPELLAEIRGRRLEMFVTDSAQKRELRKYQDITAIKHEITFCRRLYVAQDWEMVEVGGRSVEEIAKIIVEGLSERST